MWQRTYLLSGMHCGSCTEKIEAALRGVEGVIDVRITRNPSRAYLTADRLIDTETLQRALTAEGDYRLAEVDPADRSIHETEGERPLTEEKQPAERLYPLFLIVAYLLGVVVLIEALSDSPSWARGMRHFMAGFFLVFSFFKLLDPAGFVSAYREYDLIAARSKAWAWSYPYIELVLGIAYLTNGWPIGINLVTLLLMSTGALGVVRALRDRKRIRCACLGTALSLPMTKVTLVEDLAMAVMAAAMLGLYVF
ncbi:MAG: MauE/DoxX family redox-associated membrane protein [Planctomycetota bacterium]